ncbi:hypothetical protein F2Q69_00005048 [Brassica cretica]|uniref:Uncharacterized protein n=1 Tax=Brassica cretica TaxID=69181 RepID=A0A8S9PEQ9_BRACR|nr:hypothetical protein F2Q69_00005048 [Brassica cretica]
MASSTSPKIVSLCCSSYSSFDSLRLGRTTQFIVGRLLRFWDSRNIKKKALIAPNFNGHPQIQPCALFPIFILTIMAIPVVPYTMVKLSRAVSKKQRTIRCQCLECDSSGKFKRSLFKKNTLLLLNLPFPFAKAFVLLDHNHVMLYVALSSETHFAKIEKRSAADPKVTIVIRLHTFRGRQAKRQLWRKLVHGDKLRGNR